MLGGCTAIASWRYILRHGHVVLWRGCCNSLRWALRAVYLQNSRFHQWRDLLSTFFSLFFVFLPPPSLKAETSEPQKWSFASNHHRLERARLARADAPGAEGGGSICFLVAINQWRARNGWTVLHSPFSTLLYSVDKIGQHHQLPPSVVSRLFSFFLILILVCFAFAVFQLFPGQLQLKNQMMLSLSDETFSLSPEWRAELNWILP